MLQDLLISRIFHTPTHSSVSFIIIVIQLKIIYIWILNNFNKELYEIIILFKAFHFIQCETNVSYTYMSGMKIFYQRFRNSKLRNKKQFSTFHIRYNIFHVHSNNIKTPFHTLYNNFIMYNYILQSVKCTVWLIQYHTHAYIYSVYVCTHVREKN